jgi:hypothetical protein
MKKTLYMFALAALTLPTANVHAQDSTAAPVVDDGKLTLSGYIDSYYLTALNRPKSGNLMGAGAGRAFDRLTNQFALGLIQVKAAYSNKKSDMVIDLTFGPNAELGNFGNHIGAYTSGFGPSNSNQSGLYGTSAAIKQAYFTYKFTDKWNFTVGQFGTHIGYEVIDAPVNYNYSLSNLFNNGPFYHVGAKTSYAFSDKFALMAGVVNNWDALTDWKTQKSVIGQVFVSPLEGMNIYVNYIGGYHDDGFKTNSNLPGASSLNVAPAAAGSTFTPTGAATAAPTVSGGYTRQMFDLTAGYQITDKIYVGINAALGWYTWSIDKETQEFKKEGGTSVAAGGTDPDGNGKANIAYSNKAWGKAFFADSSKYQSWGGIALYANYKINDMFGIGGRFEHFDDRNGVRYFNGVNNSLTITLPITLADGHLMIKPEVRFDEGNVGIAPYKDADGKLYTVGGGYYSTPDVWGAKNAGTTVSGVPAASTPRQTTIGLAFIYKY